MSRIRHYPDRVPSLDDIARFQTSLSHDDVAWLHALVTDWQIIADLSFADLVLWVPDAEAKGMWAGAQIRPTTGPTTLFEDVAGTFMPSGRIDEIDCVVTVVLLKNSSIGTSTNAGPRCEDAGKAERLVHGRGDVVDLVRRGRGLGDALEDRRLVELLQAAGAPAVVGRATADDDERRAGEAWPARWG